MEQGTRIIWNKELEECGTRNWENMEKGTRNEELEDCGTRN